MNKTEMILRILEDEPEASNKNISRLVSRVTVHLPSQLSRQISLVRDGVNQALGQFPEAIIGHA
jgi:hypothetical protein